MRLIMGGGGYIMETASQNTSRAIENEKIIKAISLVMSVFCTNIVINGYRCHLSVAIK